jgi:hypothetical protein
VKAFSVLPSHFGILEGGMTPEANERQRQRTRELAEDHYGGPVVEIAPVVEPVPEMSRPSRPRERLPWMACIAELESEPNDPDMLASNLTRVVSVAARGARGDARPQRPVRARRDPNSVSGIFWCLGRYDRPWGPQRPIFGTVRYMSSESLRRKAAVERTLARYAPE